MQDECNLDEFSLQIRATEKGKIKQFDKTGKIGL
jgi:hypothetical protein